ncbi:MAG: hypothetical protein Tp185DCM00d2C31949991_47 [Prokaryotic dsDNA virus sp.]|nr:MAG: hypothetical protein Tp162SUR1511541_23 [Prokaryotic dsDNA virus sp.]QDP56759.1 MAG: hypothetical protein Tp185DCM00d2C31949991_47 [Prokaryotic dsDNA virus sp.]QDP63792.1 MAG: hypothetical protein Unbinned2480contig1002_46 [Prokaryotic dsDNA virus sp.]QDP63863.1 MAG: hypothetical protein GOVbin2429_47 [Prokaryotic dsDNA virus sp.]|tara:strand:- start:15522 stop:15689 length:168 start_codon:yes stop_codon:yes gene_type:complete
MKNLSGNWIDFLNFYEYYIDAPADSSIQLSREDMRMAYQSGYEKAHKEIKEKELI